MSSYSSSACSSEACQDTAVSQQCLHMDGEYGRDVGLRVPPRECDSRRTGQNIAYTVTGSGPAVVLQHGYAEYAAALSEAGFMAISTESLGHGESDMPSHASAYALEQRAGAIAAVLDAEGVYKALYWLLDRHVHG